MHHRSGSGQRPRPDRNVGLRSGVALNSALTVFPKLLRGLASYFRALLNVKIRRTSVTRKNMTRNEGKEVLIEEKITSFTLSVGARVSD